MKIEDFAAFPGAELIEEGPRDLAENRESVAALLEDSDAAHSRYNALIRRMRRLVDAARVEPHLYRYPALDPASFWRVVEKLVRGGLTD